MTTYRRFYAIYELDSGSQFAAEDRLHVEVFSGRADRDAWVRGDLDGDESPLLTYGGTRRTATKQEATRAMREIVDSCFGGRQSGREALAQEVPNYHRDTRWMWRVEP